MIATEVHHVGVKTALLQEDDAEQWQYALTASAAAVKAGPTLRGVR